MPRKFSDQDLRAMLNAPDAASAPALVAEMKTLYTRDETDTAHRARELVATYVSEDASYFSHKETIAHAVLALQLALAGVVLGAEKWPPEWLQTVALCNTPDISTMTSATLLVIFMWAMLHVFLRRQLRFARSAAVHQMAAIRLLRRWVRTPPSEADLRPFAGESAKSGRIVTLLDHFLPVPSARVQADQDHTGDSAVFVEQLTQQTKTRTAFQISEWLMTLGSLALLGVALIRCLAAH